MLRIAWLQVAQSLPVPPLELPAVFGREALEKLFVAVQYWLYALLYAGYALALAGLWLRARARGEPFRHGLLVAVAVFGGIFFLRTLGRSDEAHLVSALPPTCLLLAHALAGAVLAVSDECLHGKFGFRDPSFLDAERKTVEVARKALQFL